MIRAVLFLILWATPSLAQQLCFCPRCLLLTHANLFVPASSMHPTLPVDSCIEGRYLREGEAVPPPGSVVTFAHPVTGVTFVKRLIATEGQTVQMVDGTLVIDGVPVPQEGMRPYEQVYAPSRSGVLPRCGEAVAIGETCLTQRLLETLPNGTRYAVLNLEDGSLGDNTPEFTVPPGHVFVLGDHRDNSVDSRFAQHTGGVGMVPVENLRTIIDRPATSLE